MEISLKWNRQDLERKLLEELKAQGFRPVPSDEEDASPFTWEIASGVLGEVSISVAAEPDSDFRPALEPREPRPRRSPPDDTTAEDPVEDAGDDEPFDPTMLPPGADVMSLNTDTPEQATELTSRRRRIKGETRERPD
jgi:hypothetical protein